MSNDNREERGKTAKAIDLSLEMLPALEESIWAKLLTGTAIEIPKGFGIGPLDLSIELPKIDLSVRDFKLPEIDFEHTYRTMEKHLQQLALRCWSLPWHLGILDLEELVTKKPEEIDAFFEEYFEDGGLATLRKDIVDDKRLSKWDLLLEQCFKNYGSGDFQICIPSLIMVLEGSFNYTSFFSEGHRKDFFRKHIEAAAGFQKLTWVSLCSFCDVVFMPGNPRRTTDYPNRHKIMHGLDDPSKWRKVDCLRLFQALDSTRRLR